MKNVAADKRVELIIYCENLEANEPYFEKNCEDVKKKIQKSGESLFADQNKKIKL